MSGIYGIALRGLYLGRVLVYAEAGTLPAKSRCSFMCVVRSACESENLFATSASMDHVT